MRRFLRGLPGRRRLTPLSCTVQVTEEDVTLLESGQACARFQWREIEEVVTFKRDCLACDDIRLAFRIGDRWVEISEDVEGWSALTAPVGRSSR